MTAPDTNEAPVAEAPVVEVAPDVVATPEPVAEPAPVVAETPTPAIPFAVDQTHAFDSLPIGSLATKTSADTMTIDAPDAQTVQHPIPADDILHHLPVGAAVAMIAGTGVGQPIGTKLSMVHLPANNARGPLNFVGSHLHDVIARAWRWVVDEAKTIEGEL